MPRRQPTLELVALELHLDKAAPQSLHHQLDQGLRELLLGGKLEPGTRMPSSRSLADELGCSRNTVVAAYEQLIQEGFLNSNTGSGTYVAEALDVSVLKGPEIESRQTPVEREVTLSPVGEALVVARRAKHRYGKAFSMAGPDLTQFPTSLWSRLTARCWRSWPREMMRCDDPAGYRPLREAIAEHLKSMRGIECTADQIVMTAGATQALDLMARLLLDRDQAVWIEDPCFSTGANVLAALSARAVPVPVDEEGLSVDDGIRKAPYARMVLVTPSHQFPLGVVMSVRRRLALLDWARRSGAWIVEDDYDSDYRYSGRPLPALQALDKHGCVIYIGTFSKVLFETLRLGYVVLPEFLVEKVLAARANFDYSPALPMQPVLTKFIEEGHFATHVHRMRRVYSERREAMMHFGEKHLAGLVKFRGDSTGLHVLAEFTDALAARASDADLSSRADAAGLILTPVSTYYRETPHRPAAVMGYASITEEQIAEGSERLAAVCESFF